MIELARRALFEGQFEKTDLWLATVVGRGFAKVQLRNPTSTAALAKALGVTLPPPARLVQKNELTCFTVAPGEWLLMTDDEAQLSQLLGRIDTALQGHVSLVTDMGHAFVWLNIGGAGAREAIAALCPLDLSDAAFPDGSGARSLLGDTAAIILRLVGQHGFHLIVDQSAAPYVWRGLCRTEQR
jgi:sarcosine oxidase, subunit gamma